MPIDRRDDSERKARVEAVLKQARELRARAENARHRAREAIANAKELLARDERRVQRDALLKRAKEALRIAQASSTILLPLPMGKRRKKTG